MQEPSAILLRKKSTHENTHPWHKPQAWVIQNAGNTTQEGKVHPDWGESNVTFYGAVHVGALS
jgi:hypothetical protein